VAHFLAGVMKFRLLILAAALGLFAFGIVQTHDARLDVLPELSTPYAETPTGALRFSAVEVEHLITVPLGADLLDGVAGVDIIRSESLPSLSSTV
jgi:Cu/Ag efflux pump CusA